MRWTEEAAERLREVCDYLVERNPRAASDTVRGLYDLAASLDRFPDRGFPHRTRSGQEVRIVLHGHYRIVYRVDPGETVVVIGVFHGAMELGRYLP